MDQNQNVEPTNNQAAEEPKKSTLLTTIVAILYLIVLLVSAIIFLYFRPQNSMSFNFILYVIVGLGFIGSGLSSIVMAFGLNNMKKWFLYTSLVLALLPAGYFLMFAISVIIPNRWFVPALFLIIISVLLSVYPFYLWSIRKQFN